ncbi:MAG: T9SS type A sorting domain-containing protein [bacterium]|nr:T9SS type A sorting domain-containing protein [bacterium]
MALYEGQPVVSPTGGTWYRSKMMQRKLAEYFSFAYEDNEEFFKWFALEGRIQFWLKKNPTRAILHTVQVERNGFIHSIASGTMDDQNGYQYYGDHAYDQYVQKLPPEDIGSLMLNNDLDGKLRLTFQPVEHGEIYRIFWSRDGKNFLDWIDVQDTTVAMSSLTTDSLYFFRVQGISPWGKSQPSEVLAGVPGSTSPEVLVINGFDAVKTENTRDFVRQHADAFFANGMRPASASNDAMVAGMTNLSDYPIIDFIVGTDLYLTETVSPAEQALLKSYLQNGGKLFISGADLAFDLDSHGKGDDQNFCYNYLKTKFFARSPLSQTSVYYQAEFLADWTAVTGSFSFDNGTHGTYNVSRPNAIKAIYGGEACLIFSGVDISNGVAGVCFDGMFPSGNQPGKVVVTSIPFETIYPDSARAIFMKAALDFFEGASEVQSPGNSPVPDFSLVQNYPNPFNAETRIAFSLPARSKVRLTVYNSLGQIVARLADGFFESGWHSVTWRGGNQSSGIYISRLEALGRSQVKKMALIR